MTVANHHRDPNLESGITLRTGHGTDLMKHLTATTQVARFPTVLSSYIIYLHNLFPQYVRVTLQPPYQVTTSCNSVTMSRGNMFFTI